MTADRKQGGQWLPLPTLVTPNFCRVEFDSKQMFYPFTKDFKGESRNCPPKHIDFENHVYAIDLGKVRFPLGDYRATTSLRQQLLTGKLIYICFEFYASIKESDD